MICGIVGIGNLAGVSLGLHPWSSGYTIRPLSRSLRVRVSAGVNLSSNFRSGKHVDVSEHGKFNHWFTRFRSVEPASRYKLVGVNRGEMGRSLVL